MVNNLKSEMATQIENIYLMKKDKNETIVVCQSGQRSFSEAHYPRLAIRLMNSKRSQNSFK